MAYRRPAIEVIQEFQQAAAALALPSLPACVIGPAFQVVNDANVGVYDEADLGISSYPYTGLASGGIVDLSSAPASEAEANAHKAVSVKLKDVYLVKLPALPATSILTGRLEAPNVFADLTAAAFGGFDPDVTGAPTFYIDIISGVGINAADLGRKLVISKTDDNTLVVAAEWQTATPLLSVVYRVLQFREEEIYDASVLAANDITPDEDSVEIEPGLESVSDTVPMPVVEATVMLSWRALLPSAANALNVFTDLDSLEAVFGIGSIVPANVGPYMVNLALNNTTTSVSMTGLGADFFTDIELSFQDAFEFLENKDVYGLAAATHLPAVQQLLKSHVEGMSLSAVGRERVGFMSRTLLETEVMVPASGIGTETTAGTGNGLSGATNQTFKDPTNGSFVTDDVNTGHFLEITSYTALPGIHRTVTPNERDWFDTTPNRIQIINGGFAAGDVGRYLLVRNATTGGNNAAFLINTITSPKIVTITSPVVAADEVMPATARVWVADIVRTIAHDVLDSVVAATRTWTFTNGAFVAGDVGRILFITLAGVSGNNGVWHIASVVNGTTITTVEAPAANETFGVAVTQRIFGISREPARDVTADNVNGTSRIWEIFGAAFTQDDVGRQLVVLGATGGNNANHPIETVLSSTQIKTSNATTPVTEEFNGLAIATLTQLDVRSVVPSPIEEAYIKNTRHEINTIISEGQFTLVTDPTAGFGGTLEDVVYRITRDLTLTEQAEFLAGYAASFASRRMVSMWPDVLAVSVNGLATKVPGYFAGGPLVGMTAGLPSQAGFTNLSLVGFVGRENSDDLFSDTQLDTIAGGGNLVLVQPVADAALSVRHQLTTDVSTIFFQEFSVTKNVDLIARFFRGLYKPFIGIYNITDGLFDLLKTRGDGGISFLKAQRAPRVGAPLKSGRLTRIEESATQPDTVEIDIEISVPLPLNNIKLTLLV
jgi:hypothetical protein